MLHKSIQTITIIGAGNVATQLGTHLFEKGVRLKQIFVRNATEEHKQLAKKLHTQLCFDYKDLNANTDLIIIAVNDAAIGKVANSLACHEHLKHILVVHTSGATPMSVLEYSCQRFGIFYPLQSFSKASIVNMNTVPICVDAAIEEDKKLLLDLANILSNNVAIISDEQRAYLHVAAVLVNNFTNHLYALAEDFTAKHHTPFSMLKPLILETVHKLENMSPREAQTGPAKRKDSNTIQRHLDLIGEDKELADLYKMLSESISKYYV